ncbi:MAG: GTP cyclohydrolase II [Myxococcales bacterium]|nr:GTP cyclohydrolase II [Myxococcales bacterium]
MSQSKVSRYSECRLPTEYGTFQVVAYREEGVPVEHVAICYGEVTGDDVLCRVHSECLTGEVLHSLKCDCREQLDLSLRRIVEAGRGVVLYLRQEGRGIGLGDKIRVYQMQQKGYDTVDANRVLGFEDDLRRYHMAAAMLNDLGVKSVALMTNNPSKVEQLRGEGIVVTRREPHLVEPHALNRGYLETKRARMGHLYDLESDDEPRPMNGFDSAQLLDAE